MSDYALKHLAPHLWDAWIGLSAEDGVVTSVTAEPMTYTNTSTTVPFRPHGSGLIHRGHGAWHCHAPDRNKPALLPFIIEWDE